MNKRYAYILLALMLTLAMVLPAMAGGAAAITLQAASGPDKVSLSWTSAPDTSGLSGYYVYRSTQPGYASQTPANDFPTQVTTFTDVNVEKNVTYYYSVRPVYGKTVGTPSNEVQVTVGHASPGVTIVMTVGDPQMTVNGVAKLIDPPSGQVSPLLRNNRTFVPIRAVVESLGGTTAYDSSTRMVTITLGNTTINLWIGSKNIRVNGTDKVMDVAPFIESSRTYLPLRFVLENFSCSTDWNGNLKQVTIKRVSLAGGSTGQVSGSAPSVPGNVTPGTSGNSTSGSTSSGAGSTGSTGSIVFNPGPPVITGPSVPGTLQPPPQVLNWTGRWDTSYGILVLTQNGNQVTGTYPDGTLTGTVSGSVLTGTFVENNDYTGSFTFTMSADGRSFTGTWHYSDETETRSWTGTRMSN